MTPAEHGALAPNSAARFTALGVQLRVQPAEVTFPDGTTGVVDYSNFIGMTLGAMYDSSSWGDFAAALSDLEAQASAATIGSRLQRFWHPQHAYITKRGMPRHQNFVEAFPAVACADADDPQDSSAWSTNGAAADAQFGYFGRIWTWASSICAAWPTSDPERYVGPWNHVTSKAVLVVGNEFDPATRYEGAVTASTLLPKSRLLTVHGWGHTSLFLSSCANDVQTRYLVGLALPPVGRVCEQDHVPFTP